LEPCSQSCGAEETGGGSNLILIIVVVTTLFISIGYCTFMYYQKRPGALGKKEKTLPLQKHGQSDVITASFLTDKVRYDICQCRGLWFVPVSRGSFNVFFRP
jgi:flagellar basal body-associated protein FliL